MSHDQWQDQVDDFSPHEVATLISHDLRSPLQVAHGRVELAKTTGDMEHLEAAERAILRVEQLLDDLTTFVREDDILGNATPVHLETIAQLSWEMVGNESATLRIESTQLIRADSERFQRVLENLFSNCVIHGGEDVTVRVGMLSDQDGFYVADDGDGIDQRTMDLIFEPKFSTKSDGTGYGLPIVQRIAHAHGWSITVTTSRNGGTRFEFSDVDVIVD